MTTSKKVRLFTATATAGALEEHFPMLAPGYHRAKALALAYAIQVLRLDDFELRIVGAQQLRSSMTTHTRRDYMQNMVSGY